MSYRAYYGFRPYVPVAERRAKAERAIKKLEKKKAMFPIQLTTRVMSQTFWGKAWCRHIESFSDYDNRLPRGRTYVRNGLVCHLEIKSGVIEAMVCGSSMYRVAITVKPLLLKKWNTLKQQCLGKIGSVLELLNGKLSCEVMQLVCDPQTGLFPLSKEIDLSCNCPDWATMCKHVAAALYGVAVRLDKSPEQLFLLRGIDYQELIDPAVLLTETRPSAESQQRRIDSAQIEDIFGITLSDDRRPEEIKPTVRSHNPAVKNKAASTKTIKKIRKDTSSGIPARLTGSSISKKRRELQCSQQQFSELLGVSTSTVSRWELMKRRVLNIQAATKAKLAALWGGDSA